MANDPYVDPRTGTLRNLLGITDPRVLAQAEARLAAAAEIVLFHEHLDLGHYDLAHLRGLLVEEHAIQQGRAAELQESADLEPDLAGLLVVRCREALEEIEEALRLIERGRYGRCSVCATAVPYERLEAVPATRRCVSCQTWRQGRTR